MAVGLAAGGVALVALGKQAIDAGDNLNKLSIRLGAPVESLSRLQFAAERTGVSSKTLELSMQRLGRRIGEVATFGKGEALPALNELGISAEKLNKLSVDKQFLAIADALENVEDPGKKLVLTMKLLDTEGVKLLQTFKGGSGAIADLADQSDRLGNTMSANTAQAAADLKDSFTDLQASANGIGQELIKNLGPEIVKITKLLTNVLPGAVELATQSFVVLKAGVEGAAATFAFAGGKMAAGVQSILDAILPGAFTDVMTKDIESALGTSRALFAQMEKTYKDGLDKISQTSKGAEGSLRDIIPNIADISGTNKTTADVSKEQSTAKAFKEETETLISLQEERFRRLSIASLSAQGKDRSAEAERFAQEINEINILEGRLRDHLGTKFALEAEFDKARIDAKKISEAQITEIERSESDARRQIKDAELKVAESFFSAAGGLAKDSSKAQQALFAIEKSFALARALIALQSAKAQANASAKFPFNLAAIARVAAIGLDAISGIRSVSARATGGPVIGGQPYIVGEKGPELIVPKNDGTVIPNGGFGGSELTVNLYESNDRAGQVQQDGESLNIFVSQITNELIGQVRSGRGLGQEIAKTFNVNRRGVA